MKILVSALEPSANLHLENLLTELKGVELQGIFDEKLGAPMISPKEFSVMGFVDAIMKLFAAKKAINALVTQAAECDKVLLIDAPAFNLPLAKALKKAYPNKEIIYYILPKVWAWKKGRIAAIERYTDMQAYIFPFEKEFWTRGVFVGNPLMDEIKEKKSAPTGSNITAFLPGSRKAEITKLMPVFREVAARIEGIKILAVPPFFDDTKIAELYGNTSGFEIVRDAKYALLHASKAVVCSGTATLESAIIGTPTLLVYIAKPIDYFIATKFVTTLRHVGLANIIADFEGEGEIHPELLQDAVTTEAILGELERLDEAEFLKKSFWLRGRLEGKEKALTQFFV